MPAPKIRQVVKSPDFPKLFKDGEIAKTVSFNIFHQKDQLVHLKFYPASERLYKNRSLKIIKGNRLVHIQKGQPSTEILSVHKLGPDKPEDYLRTYIGERVFENPRCVLEEEDPHIWYLNVIPPGANNKPEKLWYMDKAETCGEHADDWHKLPTIFFVKDGIVIIVKGAAEAYGLDITSISYENRG